MTVNDAKAAGREALARVLGLPRAALGAGLILVIALGLIGALAVFGPGSYRVLFDGLSPSQGGAVIKHLQKLGIPYKLTDAGNTIEVPARDLGKARLQLGQSGQPESKGKGAWKSLEKAPMTASAASVHALHLQASESSLEHAIKQMSGASNVRVLLAVPHYTPFLADQPQPKASVVLEGAPQADGALGRAVAALVASSVPGLAQKSVVVETKGGGILYPHSHGANTMQEMAIQRRIEQTQEAKLRALLNPLYGPGNYRIAVAAHVDFSRKTIKSISYGPKSFPTSTDTTEKSRVGSRPLAMGIPGALSNQPPGPTTAPAKGTAKAAKAGKGGKGGKKSSSRVQVPHSKSKHVKHAFAVDQKDTVDHPAGWSVKSMAVSVVLNKGNPKGPSTKTVKRMIVGAIDVPKSRVQVTSANFVASPGSSIPVFNRRITLGAKATLILLSALFLLFGGVTPFLRWIRNVKADVGEPPKPRDGEMAVPELPESGINKPLGSLVGRIGEIAENDPASVARMLQRWTREAPKKD